MRPIFLVFLFFYSCAWAKSGPMEIVEKYFYLATKLDHFVQIAAKEKTRDSSAVWLKSKIAGLCREVFCGSLLDSQITRANLLVELGFYEEIFSQRPSASLVDYGDRDFVSKIEAETVKSFFIGSAQIAQEGLEKICVDYTISENLRKELQRQIDLFLGRRFNLRIKTVCVLIFKLKKKDNGWRIYRISNSYRQSEASLSFH